MNFNYSIPVELQDYVINHPEYSIVIYFDVTTNRRSLWLRTNNGGIKFNLDDDKLEEKINKFIKGE